MCNNGDQCNANGSCDAGTGLCTAATPVADGTGCDDTNAATTSDQCMGGTCVGVDLCDGVVCNNGDQCNANGSCDVGTGLCTAATPLADGASCDDGNSTTSGDVCTTGVCAGDSGPAIPASSTSAALMQILLMMLAGFGLLGGKGYLGRRGR